MLTEVRFWAQVIGDAKRTVLCPPDLESRCKGYVDARGLSGIITVVASPGCPPDQIFVIDTPAIQAATGIKFPEAHRNLCTCEECDRSA